MALRRGRPIAESRSILIGSIIPAGTIAPFGGGTVPEGWLLCDGSTVSRASYDGLFAAIGTVHGEGDGSTTFHVPDLRGRFLRGSDDMGTGAATRDPDAASRTAANTGGATGATVGSVQDDAVQGHHHQAYYGVGGASNNTTKMNPPNNNSGALTGFTGNLAVQAVLSDSTYGTARVTFESRPKNANALYIIKI